MTHYEGVKIVRGMMSVVINHESVLKALILVIFYSGFAKATEFSIPIASLVDLLNSTLSTVNLSVVENPKLYLPSQPVADYDTFVHNDLIHLMLPFDCVAERFLAETVSQHDSAGLLNSIRNTKEFCQRWEASVALVEKKFNLFEFCHLTSTPNFKSNPQFVLSLLLQNITRLHDKVAILTNCETMEMFIGELLERFMVPRKRHAANYFSFDDCFNELGKYGIDQSGEFQPLCVDIELQRISNETIINLLAPYLYIVVKIPSWSNRVLKTYFGHFSIRDDLEMCKTLLFPMMVAKFQWKRNYIKSLSMDKVISSLEKYANHERASIVWSVQDLIDNKTLTIKDQKLVVPSLFNQQELDNTITNLKDKRFCVFDSNENNIKKTIVDCMHSKITQQLKKCRFSDPHSINYYSKDSFLIEPEHQSSAFVRQNQSNLLGEESFAIKQIFEVVDAGYHSHHHTPILKELLEVNVSSSDAQFNVLLSIPLIFFLVMTLIPAFIIFILYKWLLLSLSNNSIGQNGKK